jgi:hypothetical protein
MAALGIPQNLLLGGGLFLIGFIIFIAFYIIVRLLAERKGHAHYEKENNMKKGKMN